MTSFSYIHTYIYFFFIFIFSYKFIPRTQHIFCIFIPYSKLCIVLDLFCVYFFFLSDCEFLEIKKLSLCVFAHPLTSPACYVLSFFSQIKNVTCYLLHLYCNSWVYLPCPVFKRTILCIKEHMHGSCFVTHILWLMVEETKNIEPRYEVVFGICRKVNLKSFYIHQISISERKTVSTANNSILWVNVTKHRFQLREGSNCSVLFVTGILWSPGKWFRNTKNMRKTNINLFLNSVYNSPLKCVSAAFYQLCNNVSQK